MTDSIINLQAWQVWLLSPAGRRWQAWQQFVFDKAVTDAFGYHALQWGMPLVDALRANRMPHRFMLHDTPALGVQAVSDFVALPFEAASMDLVTLPHTLELSDDAHACLREVERVLVPEGRVVITGFNPVGCWGLAERRTQWCHHLGLQPDPFLPPRGELLGVRRLRDWLRLLDFEVEHAEFGLWQPAMRTEAWMHRWDFLEKPGRRWWPVLGSVYMLQAVKRVRGMRLIGPAWKSSRLLGARPVRVARQSHRSAKEQV